MNDRRYPVSGRHRSDQETSVLARYPGQISDKHYAGEDFDDDDFDDDLYLDDEDMPSSRRRVGRRRASSGRLRERRRRRQYRRRVALAFLLLVVAAGGVFGYQMIRDKFGIIDYSGAPGPVAVVRVQPGDTAEQIAKTMASKRVVASANAFFRAAIRNSETKSVQPGYYAVPTHLSGTNAVAALVDKDARVGNVVISGGRQLHDSTDVNTGARLDGIYRKIADASCFGAGGQHRCVTYEQLDAAGATDPEGLGLAPWELTAVRQVPDRGRQLEGLLAAGTWDFDPSGSPEQILAQLVAQSARSYESTSGLASTSGDNDMTPYQKLIAASLVEREALPADMPKVARVVVNRLAANQPLELDSTVNYTLDRTEVATTDGDRERPTPWNTYAMPGLPATPISSPSLDALRAVESPTPGPWLYFVTIDKQGTTLFTDNYDEHLRNIERARQSGILDSGR